MSDEPERPSHTIRLAAWMLGGVAMGRALAPLGGNGLDWWFQAAPLIYTISGALVGLAIEIFRRFLEAPAYTK